MSSAQSIQNLLSNIPLAIQKNKRPIKQIDKQRSTPIPVAQVTKRIFSSSTYPIVLEPTISVPPLITPYEYQGVSIEFYRKKEKNITYFVVQV